MKCKGLNEVFCTKRSSTSKVIYISEEKKKKPQKKMVTHTYIYTGERGG